MLAGDHLKSASDLGIPLIGVGLLYAEGYFRQSLDANGWQQESYLNADLNLLPIETVLGPDKKPLLVQVYTRRIHCTHGSGEWGSAVQLCCFWTRTSPKTPSRTAR